MKPLLALAGSVVLLGPSLTTAQDAMKFGVRQLTVLAEDEHVRVLRCAPQAGDKTPMHSHPTTSVYVVRGGRVRYVFPDGTTKDGPLKTGEALLRAPVAHADEALDGVEAILVEQKPPA